jgi:hypothetical protein
VCLGCQEGWGGSGLRDGLGVMGLPRLQALEKRRVLRKHGLDTGPERLQHDRVKDIEPCRLLPPLRLLGRGERVPRGLHPTPLHTGRLPLSPPFDRAWGAHQGWKWRSVIRLCAACATARDGRAVRCDSCRPAIGDKLARFFRKFWEKFEIGEDSTRTATTPGPTRRTIDRRASEMPADDRHAGCLRPARWAEVCQARDIARVVERVGNTEVIEIRARGGLTRVGVEGD